MTSFRESNDGSSACQDRSNSLDPGPVTRPSSFMLTSPGACWTEILSEIFVDLGCTTDNGMYRTKPNCFSLKLPKDFCDNSLAEDHTARWGPSRRWVTKVTDEISSAMTKYSLGDRCRAFSTW